MCQLLGFAIFIGMWRLYHQHSNILQSLLIIFWQTVTESNRTFQLWRLIGPLTNDLWLLLLESNQRQALIKSTLYH